MCMLCVIPPGVTPSRDKLEASALNNPHGYGFAIVVRTENRIIRERTMNADESINRFLELREQYKDSYAMWHARYATHGSQTVDNCHPFIVGGDEQTYLAHNGVLSILMNAKEERSDTRVFAEELLPGMGGVKALDNDYIWEMLEDWTSGSKVAVLTVDPAAKHEMYLLNAKSGWEDAQGVWWSNDSCYLDYYTATTKTTKHYPSIYDEDNEEFDFWRDAYNKTTNRYECPNCTEELDIGELIDAENTCTSCGFCIDCNSVFSDCLCSYTGNSKVVNSNYQKQLLPVTGWSSREFDF